MKKRIPVDWLLKGAPFVKYRTLIDLMDRSGTDDDVATVRNRVAEHQLVRRILSKQHQDGYWGTPADIHTWWPKADTTFWLLGVLADFGLGRDHEKIALAGEYVFGTQHPSGGFGCGPPLEPYDCYTGILAEALTKLGYFDDARLQNAYDWLVQRQRRDGGFWCKNTGQPGGPRESEPSCAYASLCVLAALAVHPKLKKTVLARKVRDFLLRCWDNRETTKYAGHDSQIGTGWEKLKYPFTDYRILKYLDVLTRFDSVKSDPRMREMMDLLMSKADEDGRFRAESIHTRWSEFDFGQKASPSRWITLLAHRAMKRFWS